MKNNKEKLNNEAAESVSGGGILDWIRGRKKSKTPKAPEGSIWLESQKDYVRNNFGNTPDDVEDIFSKVSPTGFVELADSTGLYSQDKLNKLKEGLGL